MHLAFAIENDCAGLYPEAIQHYEAAIAENPLPPLEAYVNLSFVYWSLTAEPPFTFAAGISEEYSLYAAGRYREIVELGLDSYPKSLELHFWSRYFEHILFGDSFGKEDCEALFSQFVPDESIVPYFYLWLFDKESYEGQRKLLVNSVCELPTAKNKYILAVLQGACA